MRGRVIVLFVFDGTLKFEPTCSLELLKKQETIMAQYLYLLEIRASLEGIALGKGEEVQ